MRRALLIGLATLVGLVLIPAAASAATLDATFGPTLTGTAPFDATGGAGNDVDPLDDIVRTNDYVTYTWAISVNDGNSPDTTITQTLPSGIEWESPLPAFCLTGGVTPVSNISPDGSTIVCNLGDKDSSTGSADQYPVVAKVRGDIPNGTVLSSNFTVSSSDPGTPDASPSQPEVVNVTAAPRVNLIKSQPNPAESLGYNAGVWGQFVTYPVSLAVDSVLNGKGSKGNELLETPIDFDDVFTLTPGGVDFVLIGCGPNAGHISGIPNGNGGSGNSATLSGTPVCSQGFAGGDISFQVPANADLTGDHVPTNTAGGGTVPANRAYLATYYIRVFVPNQEIVDAGGVVQIDNTYGSLDAESISGQENVDPPEDNSQSIDLEATDPQPGTTSIGKWFSPSGSTTQWGQNQHIYPETTFWGFLRLSTGGHLPIPAGTVAICDMFDNTSYHLTLEGTVGPVPNQPAWLTGSAAGTGANAVLEYGTGGVRGHDPDGWGTDGTPPGARDDSCADGASPTGWSSDPATVPGGLEAITKIRVRYLAEIPAGTGDVSTLRMNFKARNVGLGETDPLETGTILANFAKISRNQDSGSPTWSGNSYNPETIGGSVGRRVILTRGDVRLAKDSDPSGRTIALSGDVIGYRINVTATGEHLPDGVMRDVTVRDTLDQYQSYVVGSGVPAPTQVIENGDGTTTLVWELGDRAINEAIPDITYEARIALNTPNNRDVINRAIVSSPDDASADSVRSDQHQVRVTQKAGILIEKTTSTPWIEPRDQLEFQVNYVNNSVTSLNGMESIDVLPWNGDARGSDFAGTVSLESVTVHDGQEVYYTSRPASEVSDNPRDPSNGAGGGTLWCTEAEILGSTAGCPAEVGASTAVRIVNTGVVPRFASFVYDLVLNTDGNRSGDVYGNRAGLATPDDAVLLSAYTPVVQDRVVASALGDYAWVDANRNGIQDAGEPPVAGMSVRLTGTDKHGRSVELTTSTAADGRYLFPHLVSGEYEIAFVLPAGYEFTGRGVGDDPALDSNADPVTGRTGPIVIESPIPLRSDQEDLTWDAGITALPGSITIIKDARPNRDVDFGFGTTGLTPAGFRLNDDGQGDENRITFGDLAAGTYGVTEQTKKGWLLAEVRCAGSGSSTVDGASVSIELGPGQEMTCTYVNEQADKPKPEPKPDPKPRMVLRKKADRDVVRQGRVVNYRIRFRNSARGSVARNVLVCDSIPRWTTVVHAGGGFFREGRVCWRVKRLPYSRSFKTRKLRLRVDREAPAGTRIVNRVRSGKATASDTVRVTRDRSSVAGRPGGVTG